LVLLYYLVAPVFFPYLLEPRGCSKGLLTPDAMYFNGFFGINISIIVGLLVLTYYKLHSSHGDVYQMKNEHRFVLSVCSIVFLIFFIITATGGSEAEVGIPFVVSIHIVFLFGTVWPYYLSLQEMKKISQQTQVELSLNEILQNTTLSIEFARYLELEFSSENLLFWNEIETFKQFIMDENKSHAEIWSEIERIFTMYIREDSPYQINLPYDIRQEVESSIENSGSVFSNELSQDTPKEERESPLSIFNKAQREIYNLLASDSLNRFRLSEGYRKARGIIGEEKKSSQKSNPTELGLSRSDIVLELETPISPVSPSS